MEHQGDALWEMTMVPARPELWTKPRIATVHVPLGAAAVFAIVKAPP